MDTVLEGANSCIAGILDDLSPSLTHSNLYDAGIASEDLWENTQKALLKTLPLIRQPLIQAGKKCSEIYLDTGIFVSDSHESITKITLTPVLLKLLSELGLLQMLTVYNDIAHDLTNENIELASNMPSSYLVSLVFENTSKNGMDAIIAESERSIPWLRLFRRAFWSHEQENTYVVPIGKCRDCSDIHKYIWGIIRRAKSVLTLAKQLHCEPHLTFSFNLSENKRLMTEIYWTVPFVQELAEYNMHLTFLIISDEIQCSPGYRRNKPEHGHGRSQTIHHHNPHRPR